MTKKKAKKPAATTVAELLKTSGVPLHVQVWLDRFERGDGHALELFGSGDYPGVNDAAFLIYDVLEARHGGESVRESSEDARDFVEEWLYTLANYYGRHVWNNADAALAVLPCFIGCDGSPMEPEGDAAYVLLRAAVERLTTKSERRAFLRQDADEQPEKDEDANLRAAFKLSRVLADPRTTPETRDEIEAELIEFSSVTRVYITHPALVRRAFQLMCESRPKGRGRDYRRARKRVLALLDSIPEEEGGE